MTPPFSLFYSNRVEELFQELKQRLFALPVDPFARRLVVVSSPPLKSWLMLQLAQDPELGIAAGLEISYPDETLKKLGLLPERSTKLELALAIEWELRQLMQRGEMAPVWAPLLEYLQGKERRLIALASELAMLFLQYRHYGRAMVGEWEKGEGNGWQAELWRRIDSKKSLPSKPLSLPSKAQLHLFSLSHLSPFHLDCFAEAAVAIPTHYYFLSPCQAFWSDLRSDRESRRLMAFWKAKGASEGQLEELESYLRDCNPLLANFGRLGREMVQQLQEREGVSEERYVDPVEEASTLLTRLQQDLLLMRTPSAALSKQPLEPTDHSVQIHVADSRLRETQVVYDQLMPLLIDQQVRPEEILVMAPDIMEYAPFIKMVFEQESGGVDFHIMEAEAPMAEPTIQGFWHLLSLAHRRWTPEELLELFALPAFRRCHHFTQEEVERLEGWIDKSGIYWGETSEHREEILKSHHFPGGMIEKSGVGTWEEGLKRLLKGFVMQEEGAIAIESTQAETLGKFLALLRSMRQDLSLLQKGTLFSLQEWASYLRCLFEAYFGDEAVDLLNQHLEALGLAGRELPDAKFSFATMQPHLEEALFRQRTSYRETHLHAVRFCPLLPMRTVPAKVVVLMGMQEGAFPRDNSDSSLNLLHTDPKANYCPSKTDFDRYLFLEAILSARQYLILTYQGTSPDDNQERAPSLLIQELLTYLDRLYEIEGATPSSRLLFRHPYHAFDKRYFSPMAPHLSYIEESYRLAKAHYQRDKSAPFLFVPKFVSLILPVHELRLDLSDLIAFAKNPLRVYFRKTLGLYLPKEEQKSGEEKFALTAWDHSMIRNLALRGDFAGGMKRLELPMGLFKEVALKEAWQTWQETHEQLAKAGVRPGELFSLEMADHFKEPRQTPEGHWQLPPLQVSTSAGKRVTLVGKLERLSPQGLVVMQKNEMERAVEALPQFLVYELLHQQRLLSGERQLIFARSGEAQPSFRDSPETDLSHYLDYYLQGLAAPSPLLPDWVPLLLKHDSDSFKKEVERSLQDDFKSSYNSELNWLMRPCKILDADAIVSHWKPMAKRLFEDLQRSWFKK